MAPAEGVPSDHVDRHAAFGVVTAAVIVSTATLVLWPATITEPYAGIVPGDPGGYFDVYFGGVPPLLVIAVVAAVGFAALNFLDSRGWFVIFTPERALGGVAVAAFLALPFAAAAIVADVSGVYRGPADMNVPLPYAPLFYPVVGYVTEIVFRVLPLALLLAAFSPLAAKLRSAQRPASGLAWLSIVAVALAEPLYQVSLSERPAAAQTFIGGHVFTISMAELYLFRRYDFVTMYAFRLVYYALWHVIWGHLRLSLLF